MRVLLFLLIITMITVPVSARNAPQKSISLWEEEALIVSFDTKGYTFYKGYFNGEMTTPIETCLRLVVIKDVHKFILPKTASFRGYVKITTPVDALNFVRFFSDTDNFYLFDGYDWIEVTTEQTAFNWGNGVISKKEYDRLQLFPPKISTSSDKSFKIERCLLNSKGDLAHVEEKVTPDGGYSLKIKRYMQRNSPVKFPKFE